jgi:hypothetical protein
MSFWNRLGPRAGAIDYGSFALEEPTEAEVERRGNLEGEEVA